MKYKIFQRIIKNILEHLEMSYEEMFDKSNKPDSVRARQLLYYLCNKRGMGATEIQNYPQNSKLKLKTQHLNSKLKFRTSGKQPENSLN